MAAQIEQEREAGTGLAPAWLKPGWLPGAALFLAVVLAYLPALDGGFIWDDDAHLPREDLRSWSGLGRIWIAPGATQQYYPVVYTAFWLEHGAWGEWAPGYHIVNVVLFAVSVLLLARVLGRLEIAGAWLAAAVFAFHPVQVESVAWITELKNILSGLFYFAAALFYLEFDRSRSWRDYVPALLLFFLGLMSKSVIATLPAAVLIVLWWQRGRLSWKRDALPLVPFFLGGMSSGLFTAWFERTLLHAHGAEYDLSLLERCLVAGRNVWFYWSKLVWPARLTFIYPRWDVSSPDVALYFYPLSVLALLGLAAWLARTWRGPLAGLLYFLVTIFPAIGFLNVYPFRYSFVADHFQYLAGLGIIVPVVTGFIRFVRPARVRVAIAGVLLLLLAALSWERTRVFQDQQTLWDDTLAKNPECWLACNNLAGLYLQEGHPEAAIAEYEAALKIKPNLFDTEFNLGNAYLQEGRAEDAAAHYQKALAIDPGDAGAHINLGLVLAGAGRLDPAIAEYRAGLKIAPGVAEGHFDLGNALKQAGQVDAAIDEYRAAIALEPQYAKAHDALGAALAKKEDATGALAELLAALRIDPRLADAHFNLGNVLLGERRLDEAAAQYRTVIALEPGLAKAHNNLGIALAQGARPAEAVAEFERALALDPASAGAQRNLELAQAAAARQTAPKAK